jgi:hypothetical protein
MLAYRVEARADPPDHSGLAQFRQRLPSACLELREISIEGCGIVIPGVEVVNQEDVDPIDSKPLQAVFKGAHHAVVAVVEDGLKLEAAEPLILDRIRAKRTPEHAPDLGRDDVLVARLAVERAAQRMFGESASVPGRRIEGAHAAVPGGADDRRRLVVIDLIEEFAQGRGAQTEFGHADVRPAKLTRLQGCEIGAAHVRDSLLKAAEARLFFRLCAETQRIALGRASFGAARGLGLGDVLREHRHDADALAMGRRHHAERLGFIETKHGLEHPDHEVARRIVVVEENDFVQARTLNARLGLCRNLGGGLAHPALLPSRVVEAAIFCTLAPPVSSQFVRPGGLSRTRSEDTRSATPAIFPKLAAMVERSPPGGRTQATGLTDNCCLMGSSD